MWRVTQTSYLGTLNLIEVPVGERSQTDTKDLQKVSRISFKKMKKFRVTSEKAAPAEQESDSTEKVRVANKVLVNAGGLEFTGKINRIKGTLVTVDVLTNCQDEKKPLKGKDAQTIAAAVDKKNPRAYKKYKNHGGRSDMVNK